MRTAFVATALLAAGAYAQNISSTCSAGLVGLLGSDAGSCLQVSKLVAVLSSTGSVVTPVEGYLTGLCNSTTPKCTNATLEQAQATITSNCSADLTSLGGLLSFVNAVVSNYDDVYAAACSKNSTTGDFCVVEGLKTIESTTSTNVTSTVLTQLLAGDNATTAVLEPAISSGQLCTSCIGGIFYEIKKITPTINETSLGQGLTTTCGADFGTVAPNTTTEGSGNATTTSTGNSTATSGASTSATAKSGAERVGATFLGFAVAAVAGVACLL